MLKKAYNYVSLLKRPIKDNKNRMIIYAVLSMMVSICSIVEPYVFGGFLDNLLTVRKIRFIVIYSVAFASIKLMGIGLDFCMSILLTKLDANIVMEYEADILEHVQNLPLAFIQKKDTSEFIDKINNDVKAMTTFLLNTIIGIFGTLVSTIIAMIYVLKTDYLFAVCIFMMFPLMYLIYKMFEKRLYIVMRETADSRTKFFAALEEELFNIKYIKVQSASKVLKNRFLKAGLMTRDKNIRREKATSGFEIVSSNMDLMAKVALFFYGGYKISEGEMTIGTLVILMSYVPMIMNGLMSFANAGKKVQECGAYYDRLKEIEDVEEDRNGKINIDRINRIDIKGLSFQYDDRQIFDDFDYSFEKGRIYVLNGVNGAGKTTLANLLLGMNINDYQGDISYNGISIRELNMRFLRRQVIGVAEQEPSLLKGSIEYNITYNNTENHGASIAEMIDAVGFKELINDLENGMKTEIISGGDNLSGGQKQKVSILRALNKNASLLVFDEPTSALDAGTKEKFISYLRSKKDDCIIIIITHDPFVVNNADVIVTVERFKCEGI